MNIRALEQSEYPTYDELALHHGTLFNRLDWVVQFGERMQPLGIFDDGGEMIGGASLYHERRFGFKFFRRAPFTPTCGPFISIKAKNPVAVLETRRKALEALEEYLSEEGYGIVMLSLDRRINDALPFFWRGYKVVPNYTYLLDLEQAQDEILKNMSSERRNDISKGKRDGLVVHATTDMQVVQQLVLGTFIRQQKGIDAEAVESVLFRYSKPDNSYAYTTYSDGRPIATCFVVHDGQTAYYLMGGYDAEVRHHGAGPMAVLASIEHAKRRCLKVFDFEGSVIPPIEKYFRGFGGTMTPYLTVNKAWLPIESALKLVKRNIF